MNITHQLFNVKENIYIPDTLLDVAGIGPGDYMEVKIRKLKVPNKE